MIRNQHTVIDAHLELAGDVINSDAYTELQHALTQLGLLIDADPLGDNKFTVTWTTRYTETAEGPF